MSANSQPSNQMLSPEQAFSASVRQDGKTVIISFKIADGYYLYRDRMAFKSDPPQQIGKPEFTQGEEKSDQFYGRQTVFKHGASVILEVKDGAPRHFSMKATYQGCAEVGVCYPPQTKIIEVNGSAPIRQAGQPGATAKNTPRSTALDIPNESTAIATQGVAKDSAPRIEPAAGRPVNDVASPKQKGTNSGEATLSRTAVGGTIGTFFLAGIALAFTACMYPLLPILSSLIAGQGATLTRRRGFLLAMSYVQGLALTYTAVGVFAGLTGGLITAWLQQPAVILSAAAMMVVFALAMFDLFAIQLPNALQSKLSQTSNGLHGGRYASVFAMGALSALIVGPCVAPPLALALGYIGSTGDALLGGAALYAMALGLGLPLLLIGTFGGQFLPRAGGWMKTVKATVGVGMLALAIFTASPFVPEWAVMVAWAMLAIGVSVFLKAFDSLGPTASAWHRLGKALGILIAISGSAQLVGALAGSNNPLEPLTGLVRSVEAQSKDAVRFRQVRNAEELDAALDRNNGRPVVLDFSADWCTACKEMDAQTFSDEHVATRLRGMTLLRIDVSSNSTTNQDLLKRFGLYGPPALVMYGKNGKEHSRVVGLISPSTLVPKLDSLL
ncbi:protein-disulfide reductase DsbD [Cupriavidus sp. TMH.W2]|uniref:protein-disulfide reductase DsbD n=1 Tax=Cupriavidus sp. TMH.W2 TaxID=3434465 RepID=UPI003D7778CE